MLNGKLRLTSDFSTLEICNNEPGEIRLHLPNGLPIHYGYAIDNVVPVWDFTTNELVFEVVTAGEYSVFIEECPELSWAVNVGEDSGVNCAPSNFQACETSIDYEINTAVSPFLSVWLEKIPHTSIPILNNNLYFIDDQNLLISNGDLIIDVSIAFGNSKLYFDASSGISVDSYLSFDKTSFTSCDATEKWKGITLTTDNALIYGFGSDNYISNAETAIVMMPNAHSLILNYVTFSDNINDVTTFNYAQNKNEENSSVVIQNCNIQKGVILNTKNLRIENNTIGGQLQNRNGIFASISENSIFAIIIHDSDNVIIKNNPSLGGLVLFSNDQVTIKNNFVSFKSVLYKPLYAMGNSNLIITGNDFIGEDIEISGVEDANALFQENYIESTVNQGLKIMNAPSPIFRCNDISGSQEALTLEANCYDTELTTNVLNSGFFDLYSSSSTFIQESQNGKRVQRGNCFEEGRVFGSFSSQFDIVASAFAVDGQENPCYLPSVNQSADGWFEDQFDPDETQNCIGNSEIGYDFSNGSPDDICAQLVHASDIANDPATKNRGMIRLTQLIKRLQAQEDAVPTCLQTFLDTTSLCGISLIMSLDEISSAADSLKFQFQLQSALTFLALDNWQSYDASIPGNSIQEKYELYELFIIEQEKLKAISSQIRMSDEESATELDALNFEECLDSISMLKKKALKLKLKEGDITEEQKNDIIRNAKLCSHEYGFVIHQYRAMAARFSEEDYSIYDENCNAKEEGEVEPRSNTKAYSNLELKIIPNPNDGNFKIISTDNDSKKIELMDAKGRVLSTFNMNLKTNDADFEGLDSGLYFIKCTFESNDIVIRKVIVY